MSEGRPVQVLLVEDDEIDAEAVRRAFRRHRIANPVALARNGREALEMLRGSEDRPPLPRPYLILLDLNMPQMTGLEFLGALRADPDLSDSIVFVLTTSDAERDISDAYERHIAGYMVKSKIGEDFLKLIGMLDHYWRMIEFPA